MDNDMSALPAKKSSTECWHDQHHIHLDPSSIFQDLVFEKSQIEEALSCFQEREVRVVIVSMSGCEEVKKDLSERLPLVKKPSPDIFVTAR